MLSGCGMAADLTLMDLRSEQERHVDICRDIYVFGRDGMRSRVDKANKQLA